MKKKSRLFLNIATIALCLCAIAVGVYSAKTASLNVGGTVGFVAHNCEVEVVGKITGATNTAGSDAAGTYYITKTQASAPKTESETISVGGSSGTSSAYFGNLHFTHNSDANANDIVMEFAITNKSAFDIKASLSTESLVLGDTNNITASVTDNDAIISSEDSATIKLTISVAESVAVDINNAVSGGIGFSFEKYSLLQYNSSFGWHINMGKVTSALATATGVAENTPIAWVPVLEVASDGSLTAFNGTLQSNKPQSGHTYYFLSYNTLPIMYGNTMKQWILYNFYYNSEYLNASNNIMLTAGERQPQYYYSWYYDATTSSMVNHVNSSGDSIYANDYSVSNIRSYINGYTAYLDYDASISEESEAQAFCPDVTTQLTNFLSLYALSDDSVYTSKITARTLEDLYTSVNYGDTSTSASAESVPDVNAPISISGTTEDKLWLMSCSEYNVVKNNSNTSHIMQAKDLGSSTGETSWWLRSHYNNSFDKGEEVYYAESTGVNRIMIQIGFNAVRPAFKIVL